MHYFFHLSESGDVTPDLEGRDFACLVDARSAAVEDARALMHHGVSLGYLDLGCHIDIEDQRGRIVLAVPYGLAVMVKH